MYYACTYMCVYDSIMFYCEFEKILEIGTRSFDDFLNCPPVKKIIEDLSWMCNDNAPMFHHNPGPQKERSSGNKLRDKINIGKN